MSKNKMLLISVVLAMCLLGGCGKEAAPVEPEAITTETVVEEKPAVGEEAEAVVEESTEETAEKVIEDPTANLSNEEWVESLNVKRPTFLVFNDITGERKALEDGAEYTLLENDEIGLITPLRWHWVGENNERLYNSTEFKYSCLIYSLNYDLISENTEFAVTYNNREGEPVTATVYLSK